MKKHIKRLQYIAIALATVFALVVLGFTGTGCTTGPDRVTIGYLGNNNTGGTQPAEQSVDTPGSLTLRANTFNRTNYRFGGWRYEGNTMTTNPGRTILPAGTTFHFGQGSNFVAFLNATWVATTTNSGHNANRHMSHWYGTARIALRTYEFPSVFPMAAIWRTNMDRALTNWNNSNANVTFVVNSTSNNRVRVTTFSTVAAYGLLLSTSSGTQMTGFEVLLHHQRITNSASNLNNFITSVMAHELGHVVGLDDNPTGQTATGTIMHTNRNRNTLINPTTFDINSVNLLYR